MSTRKVAIAFEALNYLYLIVINLNLSHNLIIRKLLDMFERRKKTGIFESMFSRKFTSSRRN